MKQKKTIRRLVALCLVGAMVFTLSGVAEAWESIPPDPYGSPMYTYSLSGSINVGGGFVVSSNGQKWSHRLSMRDVFDQPDPLMNPQPYYPSPAMNQTDPFYFTLPSVSFDPNTLNQFGNVFPMYGGGIGQAYANLPVAVCSQQPGRTSIDVQMAGGYIRYGIFYVQRDIWQTYGANNWNDPMQSLHFGVHLLGAPSALHVLVDLRYLKNELTGNDPASAAAAMPDWVLCGEAYEPLSVDYMNGAAGGTWQDLNGDGVCTADEVQNGLTVGPAVCSNAWIPSNGYNNNIPANDPIPIPVLLWVEGQTPGVSQGCDPFDSRYFYFDMDDGNQAMTPLETGDCETSSGMLAYGVTGLSYGLPQWSYGSSPGSGVDPQMLVQLQQKSGFMLEESTNTLFLPYAIEGRSVLAVDQRVLEDVEVISNLPAPIQTIVVPDGVQLLTTANRFGWQGHPCLGRLHLPAGIQFDDVLIDPMTTVVCTSTEDPVLRQYCQDRGMTYEVCAGHIPMHTHVFDNVVVTSPDYHAPGCTVYTCSGCGGSYSVTNIPMLPAPTLALQGGSGASGEVIRVTVALTGNAGMSDIMLLPQYDHQALTLQRAVASSGDLLASLVFDQSAVCPKVRVSTGSTFTGTALCTLEFAATANAAAGDYPVSMTASLTPPFDHTDTSPVSLAAAQTTVTVLPATGAPALEITSGSGTPGTMIPVTVSVRDNPGVIAMLLEASYDTNALELVRVENGTVFGDALMEAGGNTAAAPYRVCWSDNTAQAQNNTANGDLVTFWFRVRLGAAAGSYPVTVSLVPGSTCNADLQDVAFAADSASVAVSALRGDANGDGVINMRDVVAIIRSLRDPQKPIAPINADVDGSGVTDRTDAELIRKYITGGYGVVLP